MKRKCLIIAEAGVNHNGNIDLAYKLCDAAKEVGADVVKFQTWKTELIITNSVDQARYQKDNTGINQSQFEMLKSLELSYSDFEKIKHYCDSIGIVFASTADENESLEFLLQLGIPFIKIGSGEIGNIPFLRYVGQKGMPVILSTGMSSLAEIDESINAIRQGGTNNITLLHCTTNYPCQFENVNLKAMVTLGNAFHLPYGYSDHTLGSLVATSAVTLGATVIEKHFTLDKNMSGPDHKASLDINEFRQFVKDIRDTELILGDGIKRVTSCEREISKVVKKCIVAKKEIAKGTIISEEMVCVKRNDEGLASRYWDLIIGTKAKKDYNADDPIEL